MSYFEKHLRNLQRGGMRQEPGTPGYPRWQARHETPVGLMALMTIPTSWFPVDFQSNASAPTRFPTEFLWKQGHPWRVLDLREIW